MRLDTPLVKVLGDKTAKPLEDSLGLRTVGDLLHHYPFRYFQHGALTDLADLEVGDHVTVLARVKASGTHTARNGKMLGKVVVTDGTGTLELAFFGKVAKWQTDRLKPGSEHLFAGVISEFRGQRQLTHPQVFLGSDDEAFERAGKILPIYPASAAIDTIAISKCVDLVLAQVDLDQDPLPDALRLEHNLMSLREALMTVHRPQDMADVRVAHDRLRWDEAFVLQVVLAQRRKALENQGGTARAGCLGGVLDLFDARCPWVLTEGQTQ
ncbi:MAG: ATP-dependent helicase RecG, partial [Frankiales bacterium]|nr:ATP-dependent helicase RecG [Frankiales bacterium]